jgi:hypothetical protein
MTGFLTVHIFIAKLYVNHVKNRIYILSKKKEIIQKFTKNELTNGLFVFIIHIIPIGIIILPS